MNVFSHAHSWTSPWTSLYSSVRVRGLDHVQYQLLTQHSTLVTGTVTGKPVGCTTLYVDRCRTEVRLDAHISYGDCDNYYRNQNTKNDGDTADPIARTAGRVRAATSWTPRARMPRRVARGSAHARPSPRAQPRARTHPTPAPHELSSMRTEKRPLYLCVSRHSPTSRDARPLHGLSCARIAASRRLRRPMTTAAIDPPRSPRHHTSSICKTSHPARALSPPSSERHAQNRSSSRCCCCCSPASRSGRGASARLGGAPSASGELLSARSQSAMCSSSPEG